MSQRCSLTIEKNKKAITECLAPLLYCIPRAVNIKKMETELTFWVKDGIRWAILDKKLAASVNILPKASSLYFWNGEIEEATEILLLIKTKTSKVRMLSSYVRLVHPFEIPEVFSLPMDQGDVHYLKWLEEGMEED
ncbi:protein CutA homolog isoform X3 [Myotis daubentonii]|uniref:protein CutA homolog isoform X3 n=1 Tax=Myotis daubentonii TaxID=98922 RepID=UPI0028732703|nr:protein CutA homolog isoform X3 [Myotis daubentonii]